MHDLEFLLASWSTGSCAFCCQNKSSQDPLSGDPAKPIYRRAIQKRRALDWQEIIKLA